MKKLPQLVAALLALLLGLTSCSGGADSPEEKGASNKIKVGIVQLPIFAPVYVAQEKGYFKDEGLDVTIETVKSGSDAMPLVSTGKLDAAAVGFNAGMFSGFHLGMKFKVVGSMGVADGSKGPQPVDLIVPTKSKNGAPIKSLEDLKGKKIGAAGGESSTGAYLSALALENVGLSLKDVELVSLGNPDLPPALENGGIDAALIAAPFSQQPLKDGSAKSLWSPPKGVSGTGLIFGEEFMKREEAQKFFNALVRAAADLQGKKRYSEENLRIIAKGTDQDYEKVKDLPLYTWLPNLAPQGEQLDKMQRFWLEVGALDYSEPIPADQIVDNSFAEKAEVKK